MSSNNGKLITVEEAANRLNVSVRTTWKYVKANALRTTREFNEKKRRRVMVFEDSLSEFLCKNSKESPGALQSTSENLQGDVRAGSGIYSKDEALIQATYRIGWLESQLETTKKMLTEGEAHRQQREEDLRVKSEEVARLATEKTLMEAELARTRDEAGRIHREKEILAAQIKELRLPWWKRWFKVKRSEMDVI